VAVERRCPLCGTPLVLSDYYYVCPACGTVCGEELDERSVYTHRGLLALPARHLGSVPGARDARGAAPAARVRAVPGGPRRPRLRLPVRLPRWCEETAPALLERHGACMRERGVSSPELAAAALAYVYCASRGEPVAARLGRAVYAAMECLGVKYVRRDPVAFLRQLSLPPDVFARALELLPLADSLLARSRARIAAYVAEVLLRGSSGIRLSHSERRRAERLLSALLAAGSAPASPEGVISREAREGA
jgi:hypothetical protein